MQVHNVTKQVEYRGELVQLTEALSHLPAGGQVLLSDTTFKLVAHRLHDIVLPPVSALAPELSTRSRRLRLVSHPRLHALHQIMARVRCHRTVACHLAWPCPCIPAPSKAARCLLLTCFPTDHML